MALLRFPGPIGRDRDRNLLESAAYRPFQSAFGKDIFPKLVDKAAALFHALNADQPFENGCKRTSVIAVDLFLLVNWQFLALPDEELRFLAIETANYKERGQTQDQILAHITSVIGPKIVSLSSLSRAGFIRLSWKAFNLGRGVRRAVDKFG